MDWIRSVTDVEIAQMKLIYVVMYVAVGIISPDELAQMRIPDFGNVGDSSTIKSSASSIRSYNGDNKSEWVAPPDLHESQAVAASHSKRFQSIEHLVPHATKHFKGLERRAVVAKFRWLYRENSDKMVLRYIRQLGESAKVVGAIGLTIATHLKYIDAEEMMFRGESYYVFDHPNPNYMKQHEVGKRTLVGYDRQHRPVNVLAARRNNPKAQSADDLERYSLYILEQTYMACQDSADGAIIIFDMQGYSRANMDMKVAKFIVDKMNKLYPMCMNRLFVYKPPRHFQTLFKIFRTWFDPNLVSKIKFIHNPEELLAYIPVDQLPHSLGGNSTHQYKWIPPREEDDLPMHDTRTREELLKKRQELWHKLETFTKHWMVATGPQTIATVENERRSLLEQCRHVYWQLDPYLRSRSVFDRNGILGELRPELKYQGIAQPVCKPIITERDLGVSTARSYTSGDRSTLTSTLTSSLMGLESSGEVSKLAAHTNNHAGTLTA